MHKARQTPTGAERSPVDGGILGRQHGSPAIPSLIAPAANAHLPGTNLEEIDVLESPIGISHAVLGGTRTRRRPHTIETNSNRLTTLETGGSPAAKDALMQ